MARLLPAFVALRELTTGGTERRSSNRSLLRRAETGWGSGEDLVAVDIEERVGRRHRQKIAPRAAIVAGFAVRLGIGGVAMADFLA